MKSSLQREISFKKEHRRKQMITLSSKPVYWLHPQKDDIPVPYSNLEVYLLRVTDKDHIQINSPKIK